MPTFFILMQTGFMTTFLTKVRAIPMFRFLALEEIEAIFNFLTQYENQNNVYLFEFRVNHTDVYLLTFVQYVPMSPFLTLVQDRTHVKFL